MLNLIGLGLFLGLIGFILKMEWIAATGWLLLAGAILLFLWQRRVEKAVFVRRTLPEQAFYQDTIPVELVIGNRSRLPLPWLTLQDAVPTELKAEGRTHWLFSFRGREQSRVNYSLFCKTRGRYLIGPLDGATGVILDTGDLQGGTLSWPDRNRLTVYPLIVPLEQLGLPSRLPMGSLRTRQPLMHDPSRIAGVREYTPGDDPRHIDWRSSARMNELQVRQFERTRQMPLAVFLDLRLVDYQYTRRQDCELSIVVAASLVNRAHQLRQPFGLYSNGFDPFFRSYDEVNEAVKTEAGPALTPRSGDLYLSQVLDKLAGLQPRVEALPLEHMISQWTASLAWGATIAIITLEATPALASHMLQLKRSGYSPVAIFTGKSASYRSSTGYSPDNLRALNLLVFEVSNAGELNLAGIKG
ncbi:MAG TPA: DUF58 domain-containing protein [Chloroflexia bacterium]|nr:DUF58 domain-containing protein [Chloroflexia bacterium]